MTAAVLSLVAGGGGGADGHGTLPDDGRPVVEVGPDLSAAVDASVAALALDPACYQRADELVRIVGDAAGEGSGAGQPSQPSEPRILPHRPGSLRTALAAAALYVAPGSRGPRPIQPPRDLVSAVAESPERWSPIRHLAGVASYPVLLPSGDVLETPGYHAGSRLLYAPSVAVPEIPRTPTADQAQRALRWLWTHLCGDFPYQGLGYPEHSDADPDGIHRYLVARECPSAWGVIAAILSLLARPAIAGDVPAILFDASTPGSGKGLQLDVVSTAVLGRVSGKLTWPSHGGPQAEHTIEQALAGEARSAAPVVVWDEIVGAFGGPSINRVLTGGGRTKFRLLGQSQVLELPWTAVMLGAGNNIAWRDNTHRRVLVPRLEPPTDSPESWSGRRRHPELLSWVAANRAQILRMALTVLRGWIVAGRPDMEIAAWGGGFEAWTAVPRAIRWAGGGLVLGCRPASQGEAISEEQSQIVAIIASMERVQTPDGITVGRLIDALYSPERIRGRDADGGPLAPDGHEDARDAIGAATRTRPGQRPDPSGLGRLFRTWRRRVVGGRVLEVVGVSHGAQRWLVRPVATAASAATLAAPSAQTTPNRL